MKPIEGFPNYLIKENGEVFSLKTGKILKPSLSKSGYLQFNLINKNGASSILLHRILMIAFKFNPFYKTLQVNHIDGDKLNNDLENLEWVTASKNTQHAFDTGLTPKGASHYNTNISDFQIMEIISLRENGLSYKEIAKKYNTTRQSISNYCRGIGRTKSLFS